MKILKIKTEWGQCGGHVNIAMVENDDGIIRQGYWDDEEMYRKIIFSKIDNNKQITKEDVYNLVRAVRNKK